MDVQKLKIYYDFNSQIKHIWLTGWVLITWEWERGDWTLEVFRQTVSIAWYKGGNYE